MEKCISDIKNIVARGRISLVEQVRAYDLLDSLLAMDQTDREAWLPDGSAERYCEAYKAAEAALTECYDEDALNEEAVGLLEPLQKEVEDLRFAAASAASLHEFAKEVFEIWQTQGIFARKRALKELRDRAGFRLESHRIGNYVAKTFDLMNEAQARFARAQQALFAADVRYKIRKDIYGEIYRACYK